MQVMPPRITKRTESTPGTSSSPSETMRSSTDLWPTLPLLREEFFPASTPTYSPVVARRTTNMVPVRLFELKKLIS